MRRRGPGLRIAVAALPALVLGAAAAADVPPDPLAKVARQMGLQPGKWHSVVTVASMQLLAPPSPKNPSGGPPTTIPLNSVQEQDECVGDGGQNDGGLPMPGMHFNSECRYEEGTVADGRWSIKAHCRAASGGAEGDMTVTGHYAPAADATVDLFAADPTGARVRIAMTLKSSRTGACAAPPPAKR